MNAAGTRISEGIRALARKKAERRHGNAFNAAQEHARTCARCFHPIIDAEGNPGLRGEACQPGLRILREYEAAEKELFSLGRTAEPFDLPSSCNACDAVGPVHPVTGYCEECQKGSVRG